MSETTKQPIRRCALSRNFYVNIFDAQGNRILDVNHILRINEVNDDNIMLTIVPFEGMFSQVENFIKTCKSTKEPCIIEIILTDRTGNPATSIVYNECQVNNITYPTFDYSKNDEVVLYSTEFHYGNKNVTDIYDNALGEGEKKEEVKEIDSPKTEE